MTFNSVDEIAAHFKIRSPQDLKLLFNTAAGAAETEVDTSGLGEADAALAQALAAAACLGARRVRPPAPPAPPAPTLNRKFALLVGAIGLVWLVGVGIMAFTYSNAADVRAAAATKEASLAKATAASSATSLKEWEKKTADMTTQLEKLNAAIGAGQTENANAFAANLLKLTTENTRLLRENSRLSAENGQLRAEAVKK